MSRAAIIYARSGSKRLPQKCNLEISDSNLTLIDWIFIRSQMLLVDRIILATTSNPCDDSLAQYVKEAYSAKVSIFRGHPEDLVDRTIKCLDKFKICQFVRINGDSPFFPTSEINNALEALSLNKELKFVTNLFYRTYPYGVAVEVLDAHYYRDASMKFGKKSEHLTQHLYKKMGSETRNIRNNENYSNISLTVDTRTDYTNVRRLICDRHLNPKSDWRTAI
ncbi:cytidylyltransferase domain-containing protein [Rhodobacteraceae bacterium nBUS_24]